MAKYVIGDLCNCLSDDEWEAFCNRDVIPDGVYIFRTAYGDGTYIGSDGFAYGVDSGTIGICPLDKVSAPDKLREALKYRVVQIVDIDEIAEESVSEKDGVITFDKVIIDTAA
jgi:hypothetical protein